MSLDNKYSKIANFGQTLLSKKSLVEGLPHISLYAKEIIGAERCSVFVYNKSNDTLWTTLADGIDKIVVPAEKGIVGHTFMTKEPVIVFDAKRDPLFLSKIDEESGFVTKNLITAPIFNSNRNVIGVLQLLNKEEGFDEEDVKFMTFFAHYVSGFIELATLYKR